VLIRRLRAVVVAALALVLIAGCNDDKDKQNPQPKGIATAKPGEVVSVIGDGTGNGGEEGPAATSPAPGPSALAEGRDGALLVGLRNPGEIVAISPQGQAHWVAYATSGIGSDALSSMALLADGRIATLEGPSWGREGIRLGRLDASGKLVDVARASTRGPRRRGDPQLSVLAGNDLVVVWDGIAWTLRAGKLVPNRPAVPGALRVVQDGADLLVATNEKVYRVRGGKAVWSAPIRPATGRGQGGLVTSVVPDGNRGAYVAMSDPAVVNHVTVQGGVRPVADMRDVFTCYGDVGGSALGRAPLKDPRALLLRPGQLLIADRGCNRVLSVGVS
jgi:hypothetical protein